MNERQRKISWAVYFAIFLAVIREAIRIKDSNNRFSWQSVITEVSIVLFIGLICFYFAQNKIK